MRRGTTEPEYLLVHRQRYDDWSLPKGKLDDGESYRAAALREIEEETGITPRVMAKLGTVAYETPNRNHKVVRFWLTEAANTRKFRPNKEVDDMVWLSAKNARRLATYSRDHEVLNWAIRLVEEPQAVRVFLVRHVHAGKKKDWQGEDRNRPITELGRIQAAALDDLLTRFPTTRVLTSPHVRCRQTVTPLASALGTRSKVLDELEETAHPEDLARYMKTLSGESVIMCTHGDVVSAYIGMTAAEGAHLDGPQRWAKGSVWVLDVLNGRVQRGRYWPPPLQTLA